jgi:hypothetical protein
LAIVVLLTAPAIAGPPFRTDDPEPVDFQHFEIYLFSLGTQIAGARSGMLPGLEVDYGALPNLQIATVIPQGYAAQSGRHHSFALEDLELGAKYRFLAPGEASWLPQAAFYPLVLVPVGNQKFGFSTGHAQVFLPIWLQKDVGPWTAYGGGGCWMNPGGGNRNYGFLGAALWRKMDERLRLGIEVFHQTSVSSAVKASTGFDVGAIYDWSNTWHLLASVGTGIQSRADTNQFSFYVAVSLTF